MMNKIRKRRSPRNHDQYNLVDAFDTVLSGRLKSQRGLSSSSELPESFGDGKAYNDARNIIKAREAALGFEHTCKGNAEDIEKQADEIIQQVKLNDLRVYEEEPKRIGYGGQLHPHFYGDRFLSSADVIEKTKLFEICRKMPKGAHLHIHFNANLLPHVLIDVAKEMDNMYIMSNKPLLQIGPGVFSGFDECEITFQIFGEKNLRKKLGDKPSANLFDKDYQAGQPMSFKLFRDNFPGLPKPVRRNQALSNGSLSKEKYTVEEWLYQKLVFQEEEAYNSLQTANGAWEKFNGRTRMMKGLFNYERAYRTYTRLCLEDFSDDNIQYAEIRPNFMQTNQVWKDDGSEQFNNEEIMDLIIEEYNKFQKGHERKTVKGLKIIYCTPRSFSKEQVEEMLNECLDFKKKPKFERWIAGFDLVGEESKGNTLNTFAEVFIQFKEDCRAAKVDIPFLLHCGETLDFGTDTDGNLFDALLLGSKRIGHGFALPRHPYVMEQMKKKGVCVEVCPISNEILGLTPRINGHAIYNLLANNVHCTISTDNGTLFRSRLSHDFYQVMAGKADMTIHGWRQLIEWSIEHSCMEDGLKAEVQTAWKQEWQKFCDKIVKDKDYLLSPSDKGPSPNDPEYWNGWQKRQQKAAADNARTDVQMSG